ncbi:glycosyl hydrolase family 16 [Phlyctema vagabunda]|uniref:Crh-like protein n=1 Tax=Phlyctema vagabunda TaxID=108571 RepID=A0ABR4PDN3_9HELO
MVRTSTFLAAVLATASTAHAQLACSVDSHCPEATPCCSQYGACGVGAYCLGGCDPRSSFTLDSCVPAPVCESKDYTFKTMDGITSKAKYLGDSSKTDWVMDGQAVIYNDNVLLTMAPETVGTVLASSTYMWYGKVSAKLKTSRGQGVVTGFILMSDVKDEIDYEFVGSELTTAQSNYYFQGITNYGNSGNITLSDTFNNYHTYEINWTPDQITWSVDGQVGRTKKRSETWNATSNQWDFPQTPARVQLSIWPGGLASNAKGTIDWAGGEIDWNSQDIQSNGYDYAMFESVSVECFDASSAPGTNKKTSYTYKSDVGTNDTVVDGDKPTILKSLLGTGTNMSAGLLQSSASATAETIPGLSGAGPGTNGHADDSESSSSATATATDSGDSGSTETSAAGSDSTCSSGFCQGNGGASSSSSSSSSQSSADKLNSQERILSASIFAGLVVVVAMMAL